MKATLIVGVVCLALGLALGYCYRPSVPVSPEVIEAQRRVDSLAAEFTKDSAVAADSLRRLDSLRAVSAKREAALRHTNAEQADALARFRAGLPDTASSVPREVFEQVVAALDSANALVAVVTIDRDVANAAAELWQSQTAAALKLYQGSKSLALALTVENKALRVKAKGCRVPVLGVACPQIGLGGAAGITSTGKPALLAGVTLSIPIRR